MTHGITIKTPEDIKTIRQGGKILAGILDKLCKTAKAGVTTEELDVLAEKLMHQAGGEPAFKGYKPNNERTAFSTTICACLNNEVVHAPAVPSRMLKDGDLLKIDIGMRWPVSSCTTPNPSSERRGTISSPFEGEAGRGLFTDMARTVMIGKVDQRARELVRVTEKALQMGIKQVRAGHRVSHISKAIEKFVEKYGFGIVRELVGHGVGYKIHEPPEIPNFWQDGLPDPILEEGMVIAIEPMINLGTWRVKVGADGWTIMTMDNSLSAHFEHTVVVRKRGVEVLTR